MGDDANKDNPPAAIEEQVDPKADNAAKRRRIILNVAMVSLAYCLLLGNFGNVTKLQSSINKSIGNLSLSALYLGLVLSCSFLSPWLIQTFKLKYLVLGCISCFIPYFGVQLQSSIYPHVSSSLLVGLAYGAIMPIGMTYISNYANLAAELSGEEPKSLMTKFFGGFFMLYRITEASVNGLSSFVYSRGSHLIISDKEDYSICGRYYCPSQVNNSSMTLTNKNLKRPDDYLVYIMVGVSILSSLMAMLIVWLFAEDFPKSETDKGEELSQGSNTQLLIGTYKLMCHPYQILIIPLTLWSGIGQAFLGGDITLAWVSCLLGIHMVGYTMVCFGLFDAVASILFTSCNKAMGRIPIFTTAAAANTLVIVYLMFWEPSPGDSYIFYIIAGLWGIADGVWHAQLQSMVGSIFGSSSKSAAFSNYCLWQSLGYMTSYILSSFVCVDTKLNIIAALLAIGMIGYYVVEALERYRPIPKI